MSEKTTLELRAEQDKHLPMQIAVMSAANRLQALGKTVYTDQLGMFRIDEGPELTLHQFLQVAGQMLPPTD